MTTSTGESGAEATIASIRAEQRDDALGVASASPRLSWKVSTEVEGWLQRAYELELDRGGQTFATGVVESRDSVLLRWPFDPLNSRERVYIRVRAHDCSGLMTRWSDPLAIEAGLLEARDWTAQFIGPDWDENLTTPQPAPYLRHEFEVSKPVVEARLYTTSLGVYEPYVNGALVSDHVLAPGWTSYDHRVRVQTLDVTPHIKTGRNAIGAILGDGWYRGRLGPHGGRRNLYGDRLALLAQLEIRHHDGSTTVVCTDDTWRASTGPILSSDLYDGETYDARLELEGWSSVGFDDRTWGGVRLMPRNLETLCPPLGPPVRRTEIIQPVAITRSPAGRVIVDFGQNLVGRLRIRVSGERGGTITLRHAEVLEDGELCVRPLREAAATDSYTLRGGNEETWEPRFTFHGFRYAEIVGWPGEVGCEAVSAVVCHSDLTRTGTFVCSDEFVNQLHRNVVWSMRGNFLDVPTDCPQRDERMGWTGDVQIFAPTAMFLYDTAGFLSSWLADLVVEQSPDGQVSNVVPKVMDGLRRGSHNHEVSAAAWGDAAVIVPWTIFQFAGDRGILERQYSSMCAWVDHIDRLAGPTHVWNHGFQYGDWLDPTAPPSSPEHGQTEPALVATAYFAHSADLLAGIAAMLNRASDATRYAHLCREVKAAFLKTYVLPEGRLTSDSATAYALALAFDLVDGDYREYAGQRLAEVVRADGFRINTGFVGTPLICDALVTAGAVDDAYRLLLQQECPSWLYPLTMGATTIWERWDSMLPDGSVNPGEMTSFNHYALGAVADWLHRALAGLAAAEPGFRRIEIAPRLGGGLTHARATLETPYGYAESGWRIIDGVIVVRAVVPPNTVATVRLPGITDPIEVTSGTHEWRIPEITLNERLAAAGAT